ncbi:MAG: ssl1498 family light-harvesting-like protein, partial [Cyanobacteria bacterium J06555_12]
MPYTKDERGVMNNFPIETRDRLAEPPTKQQKIQYAILGVIAAALLGGLMWVAVSV